MGTRTSRRNVPVRHPQGSPPRRVVPHVPRTIEEIPTLELEFTSPYYDRHGIKVTANGYDWSERMMDPEYLHALTTPYEPPDPADWDDFDDRD